MVGVFILGAGNHLSRADALTLGPVATAILHGLFGVVVFQFTVGSVWASAVEYRNAGGRWTDLAFLAPFGVTLAVVVAYFLTVVDPTLGGVAAALWVGVFVFAGALAVTSLAVRVALGYRDGAGASG